MKKTSALCLEGIPVEQQTDSRPVNPNTNTQIPTETKTTTPAIDKTEEELLKLYIKNFTCMLL